MQLRTRVLIAIVLSCTALVATLGFGGWRINSATNAEMATLNTNAKISLWRQIIASQQEAMEGSAKALARDRTTTKALKDRDAATLKDAVDTTFNLLTASEVITRLQIVGLDGAVLYSAPKAFTGKTVMPSVYEAMDKGEIRRSTERDADGKLVNTVSYPLYYRGKLIGAGILGSSLEPAMAAFKRNDNAEVLVLSAEGTQEHTTNPQLTSEVKLSVPPLGATQFDTAALSEGKYYQTVVPIQRFDGEPLAHLVALNDATAYLSAKSRTVSLVLAVVLLVVAGVAIGAFFYIRRSFKPLERSIEVLGRIAEGNLAQTIDGVGKDETGRLAAAMQRMNDALRGTVGSITSAAKNVNDASDEVKSATADMLSQISEMSEQTEQAATAVNEMAVTVHEIAQNANEAAQAAGRADKASRDGSAAVSDVGESIEQLTQKVHDAGDLVSQLSEDARGVTVVLDVIKSIAEQTNLLALNAAIEAARAGEQGRGFAVVADEVRTLASRTQSSTAEINEIVERLSQAADRAVQAMGSSEETAKDTVSRAQAARQMLSEITAAVTEINDMNLQIASATEEQSSVGDEVARNVERIRGVASSLTTHSEQASRAGQTTAAVADDLTRAVRTFKL